MVLQSLETAARKNARRISRAAAFGARVLRQQAVEAASERLKEVQRLFFTLSEQRR
jgi:vacuolar-type H+-ATPase subunit E/Vma4